MTAEPKPVVTVGANELGAAKPKVGEDELTGALSFSSPTSLPYALDELVLALAADGDPRTRVAQVRCR